MYEAAISVCLASNGEHRVMLRSRKAAEYCRSQGTKSSLGFVVDICTWHLVPGIFQGSGP